MNVEQWFENPNTYDFDFYGGKIMDNQDAMGAGCSNGQKGVFNVRVLDGVN
jgi:hypothetical protein